MAELSDIRPEEQYQAFLEEGRFMLLRSRSSGQCMFYPRVAEPKTGATDLEWMPASGRGVVYATTAINQRPPNKPYNVALIDLEEGPRMMSRVDGIAAQDVKIGMAVEAAIVREDDRAIVVFKPV
jgi:uncharacterized OB-fold protein